MSRGSIRCWSSGCGRWPHSTPGWQVEVDAVAPAVGAPDSGGVEIQLSHPYSHGTGLFVSDRFTASDVDARTEEVERWLLEDGVRWEVDLLTAAPDSPDNPEQVRWLRLHAELFGWSSLEVRCIANNLEGAGLLGHAEAEWVREHLGEDAPYLPRSNPHPRRFRPRRASDPFGPRDARRVLDVPKSGDRRRPS